MSATQSIINKSLLIASASNGELRGGLDWHSTDLYRHPSGRYFLVERGGPRTRVDHTPHWIDRDAAIDWVAAKARDPISGYGYTREQAEQMVAGQDAGRGYRQID